MFFCYNQEKSIKVPSPFNRIITPIMTSDLVKRSLDFSIHMTEWDPGTKVDLHSHPDATEAMYCISGIGIASVAGKDYSLLPDTMITAFPGDEHQIINTGKDKLRVLCIFSPPVSTDSLKNRAENAVVCDKVAEEI